VLSREDFEGCDLTIGRLGGSARTLSASALQDDNDFCVGCEIRLRKLNRSRFDVLAFGIRVVVWVLRRDSTEAGDLVVFQFDNKAQL
jgi:hypothetical protein